MLKKTVFSSHDLPEHLDERHRFSQWQDIHVAEIWSVEYGLSGNVAFEAAIEAAPIGELVYGQMSGTIKHATRRASNIAEDGRDGYLLLINAGETTLSGVQVGREFSVGRGEAALVSAAEPLRMVGGDKNVWTNVVTPRHALADTFNAVDDLLACRIAADSEALALLKCYLQMLEAGPFTSPEVIAHASGTIIDLIGLSIGAKGDSAELAGVGGLRSARLQAVLGHIRAGYTDVAFSTRDVATALGISARYVNDILQETGSSFSERVLELRLQRARAMLGDRRCAAMRIGEIAFAAGFADTSHFNRRFRRRFGLTPTAAR